MGGGVMRTAAKAAAFTGFRSTAARRAPAMPSAAPSSTVHVVIDGESAPLIAAISSESAPARPAMVQWPAWDDWEFASEIGAGQGIEAAAVLDPPPRLVFGPVPTLEEATEATTDLKEAIEKVYFSSGDAEHIGESAAILPSMSKHVVQAFSLLQGSQEAQCVVASLACDNNVWDAVMKNEKVLEFFNKHQSVILPPEMNDTPIEENLGLEGLFSETVESPDEETSEGSAFFTDIFQTIKVQVSCVKEKIKVKVSCAREKIKVKVSEMLSSISCFVEDFMGVSSGNHDTTNTGTSTSSSADYANLVRGSFIALAVATIVVILVKRS